MYITSSLCFCVPWQTQISRGLQLEGQVVTADQELQAAVASSQQSSKLPYLSISALQDRVKEAVAQSKVGDTKCCLLYPARPMAPCTTPLCCIQLNSNCGLVIFS